nr:MAG TPA: hypothetical protein [Caudoviricetes sp.]
MARIHCKAVTPQLQYTPSTSYIVSRRQLFDNGCYFYTQKGGTYGKS